MSRPLISWDTETPVMRMGCLVPPMVCISAAARTTDGDLDAWCSSSADEDMPTTRRLLETIFHADVEMALQNGPFDLAVVANSYPEYWPDVWRVLAEGRVHDLIIREKLLHLTTHGNLEYFSTAPGVNVKIEYNLAALEKKYLGIDRSFEKDSEEHWRHHFDKLLGVPIAQYPREALDYVLTDATSPIRIYEFQEQERQRIIAERGVDPFTVETIRSCMNFALWLVSAWGVTTDPEEIARISQMLEEEYHSYDKNNLLIEQGILRPAVPARPYANGATNDDGSPKMTQPKAASMNKAKLAAYVQDLCERDRRFKLKKTKPSERFPEGQVSVDKEWRDEYAHFDPVLTQLDDREKLKKLVTTEIPRVLDAEGNAAGRVHPSFDVLKETGRTSSYGHDKWPSMNIQNVDPRARGIIVPSPGNVMFSVDYSQGELGTFAQTCLNLFGFSVMAEKINAGYDLHSYLGAQIALRMEPAFAQLCMSADAKTPDDQYRIFKAFEQDPDDSPGRLFYEHYRKLAKPTGLGYPGGLGPNTFIAFAKSPYGVIVDLQTAKLLREIWLSTFPEAKLYFEHINKNLIDPFNEQRFLDEETGKWTKRTTYRYLTPYGMLRSGTGYCPASNGLGLQSPFAEGALTALYNTVRACYDPSLRTILYDDSTGWTCRILGFIHDELLGETRLDQYVTQRMQAIEDIMIRSLRIITPDVAVRVSVALMERWNKRAHSELDEHGNYTIWKPAAQE